MTFDQKASLAKKYLSIFNNHSSAIMLIALAIFVVSLVFATLYHIRNGHTSMITESKIGVGILFSIILFMCAAVDVPNIRSNDGRTMHATVNALIVNYHYRLPHVQHAANVNYQKAKTAKGVNIYEYGKKYHVNEKKSKKMRHYLKHHSPKAPWLNFRF